MRDAAITGLESIKEGKEIGWLCTSEPLGRYKTLYLSTQAPPGSQASSEDPNRVFCFPKFRNKSASTAKSRVFSVAPYRTGVRISRVLLRALLRRFRRRTGGLAGTRLGQRPRPHPAALPGRLPQGGSESRGFPPYNRVECKLRPALYSQATTLS